MSLVSLSKTHVSEAHDVFDFAEGQRTGGR